MRVLVVEDDTDLALAVVLALRGAALAVDEAANLATADQLRFSNDYDCAVFDRMLPDGDGLLYVHQQRQAGWEVPVLFLTARDSPADRVAGFEHGGDDYLVKPFGVVEMVARVRSLCRRAGQRRPAVLRYADLELDGARRQVRRRAVLLTLTGKEFAVLEFLLARPDLAVSRAEIEEHCWDAMAEPMSNVVDVVIAQLRRKLGEPQLIGTVRGFGYQLSAAPGPP
jgi:DNA-binding response OmpR family regulator